MKLKCYCCGEPIGDTFFLMNADEKGEVDRVFVLSLRCAQRAEGGKILVDRAKRKLQVTRLKRYGRR